MEAGGKPGLSPSATFAATGKTSSRSQGSRRHSTNTGAICSGSSRAIWTTRTCPRATIWSWPIEAREAVARRARPWRANSPPRIQPADQSRRPQRLLETQSGSRGRAAPEISDIVAIAARIEPLAKPGDILLSQQFVDDARRYGYRLEEEPPSLVDDQYVGAHRYQAGAGVLISKDSETAQHVQIYLFGHAADAKSGSGL